MSESTSCEADESALLALLDDHSPTVRKAVVQELSRREARGLQLLQEAAEGNGSIAEAAREILSELQVPEPAEQLRRFIYSFQYELESGCLMIERTIFPQMDAGEYYRFMDRLRLRCQELMIQPCSAREQCRVISRVLFHEYGFRGDYEHYSNPLNSYLMQVINRRKGIPISLSILYLLLAQRLGLQLEPIGLPGHFLVGCFSEEEPFYVDPFLMGALRSVDQVRALLASNAIEDEDRFLRPSPVREVLARCCRNLVHQYAAEEDMERARFFSGFVQAFEDAYRRHAQP